MTKEEFVRNGSWILKVIRDRCELTQAETDYLNYLIEVLEQEPCRETDDYENEIADLHNRLDIAEYDKERLREEVTNLEEKIKALEQEPCEDCRTCNKWSECECGEKGHKNGTSIGYSIGECKDYEPCEDCISRAEAKNCITRNEVRFRMIEELEALPSVQPKPKTEWIPVSERLPKDEQDVLIQYGNSMFVGYHRTDCTNYDPQFEDLNDTGWYNEQDEFIDSSYSITAWMPLPEPYTAEKE